MRDTAQKTGPFIFNIKAGNAGKNKKIGAKKGRGKKPQAYLSGKKAGNFFEHGGLLKAFAFGSFLKSDLLNAAAYGNPGTGIGF